jgi:hypothetical protein
LDGPERVYGSGLFLWGCFADVSCFVRCVE